MSKLLGIDYGQSKIGLAIADLETKTAVPLEVVRNNELGIRIKDLIESEKVEKIVVGLPIGLDGKETGQTKEVQEFIKNLILKIKNLKLKTKIEVITEDERLTTAQAKKVQKDDAVAAMYILQSYLDKHY